MLVTAILSNAIARIDTATREVTRIYDRAAHGTVSVVDVAAREVLDTISVGAVPKRIVYVDVP